MDELFRSLQIILIWAIPVLFAITVHEVAHGFVANKFGDKTALMLGRITLNPFKHIDLVGTIIVPIVFLVLGGFVFGWAKPVPVSWRNLRNPRRDMALVALAGPFANLLMAIMWAAVAKIFMVLMQGGFENGKVMMFMGIAGISINLMLMILNLIPIPPLDGSRVLSSLLPPKLSASFDALTPYGFMILILLIFTGALAVILNTPYSAMQEGMLHLFSIR